MSLEQKIDTLTAAVAELTATMIAVTKAAPGAAAADAEEKPAAKSKPASKAKSEDEEETKPATKGKAKPAADEEDAPAKVTKEQMVAALNKLKEEHPDAVEACKPIIKKQGKAAKMAEIEPDNYAAVYNEAVKQIKALEDGDGGDGM